MSQTAATKTCILIPTFSAYLPVARITRFLLSKYWPQHPPIYLAGCDIGDSEERWLTLRSEVTDWCAIVADACDDLITSGFENVYLILDDHPPINSCNERHLNATLPNLREQLDATYIGLNGWGYGRAARRLNGKLHSRANWNIEHVAPDFPWKFSLHPGLWSIEHLCVLARSIQNLNPPERRNAWVFERMANSVNPGVGTNFDNGCYRISGRSMTASSRRYFLHGAAYLALRGCRHSIGHRLDNSIDALGCYYEGPYPLFWSGLIVQGHINSKLMTYIRMCRRKGLRKLLNSRLPSRFSITNP